MLQPTVCHSYGTLALIALGGNVTSSFGTPVQTLRAAIADLPDYGCMPERISPIYRSPAFPAGSGPDFANAVVAARVGDDAGQVLAALHRIEARHARQRHARWAPRTLDLDLLAHGASVLPNEAEFRRWADLAPEQQQVQAPQTLVLPHPRLHERGFVLKPLCDVAPEWCHPVFGLSAAQMLARLDPALLDGIVPAETG